MASILNKSRQGNLRKSGVEIEWRTDELKARVREAQFKATQEVFTLDIVPEAQQTSPVSERWPSIPAARGEKRIDTGNNRNKIDSEVTQEGTQTVARMFTFSGYGGYLETGTAKMPARPYLWPSFINNIQKVKTIMRRMLHGGH